MLLRVYEHSCRYINLEIYNILYKFAVSKSVPLMVRGCEMRVQCECNLFGRFLIKSAYF